MFFLNILILSCMIILYNVEKVVIFYKLLVQKNNTMSY